MPEYNEKQILLKKVADLFPDPQQQEQAHAVLSEYGKEASDLEPDRVRLAILKLAGADLECLKETTVSAKRDYRDILAWAEYPNQTIARSLPDGPKKQKMIQTDLEQYTTWLFE
ncbi:MAG: hypothetical protein ACOZF0_04925 [Thermodesulfobacteriota bacterium]